MDLRSSSSAAAAASAMALDVFPPPTSPPVSHRPVLSLPITRGPAELLVSAGSP